MAIKFIFYILMMDIVCAETNKESQDTSPHWIIVSVFAGIIIPLLLFLLFAFYEMVQEVMLSK